MTAPTIDRRRVLKQGGLLAMLAAAGFAVPRDARAAVDSAAFEGKTLDEALRALGVAAKPADSALVRLIAPEIAENGAAVPVQAISNLPGTERLAILIEKNPNALAAVFEVGPDAVADFATRVKLAQTSNVVVLVKAEGRFHAAVKEIKVTIGGCGG